MKKDTVLYKDRSKHRIFYHINRESHSCYDNVAKQIM